MRKIAINQCRGGFGLSPTATQLYLKKIGKKCFFYKQTSYAHQGKEEHKRISLEEAEKESFVSIYTKDMGETINQHSDEHYWYENFHEKRDDKILIEVIEELGTKKASQKLGEIKIVEIPDDVDFQINDYDGMESIHEKHRT